MTTKTINESPSGTLAIRSDGTAAGTTAIVTIGDETGLPHTSVDVDIAAALAAAAAAIGGGRTSAEVRECVRQFYIGARTQARAAGGWA